VNIFLLDESPGVAARMHCDKLSTAHRMLDGKEYLAPSKSGKRMTKHYLLERNDDVIYKAVHAAHPCTVWTMQSASNYIWHYGLFHALSEEFEYRFKKIHRSWDILKYILSVIPKNIPDIGPTPYESIPRHCCYRRSS
jgi:hypothetical protein